MIATVAPWGFRLDAVDVRYGARTALRAITAELPREGFVVVAGPNGGGKSTLLRALMGWVPIAAGTVAAAAGADGKPRTVAYLPQRAEVDVDFPVTVREIVEMGRLRPTGAWRRFRDDDAAAVDSAITELGLSDLQDRRLSELSGGQQQRALLARATATGAEVFLLDEPFAGLDAEATADLSARLGRWASAGRLVIAVLHDLAMARRIGTFALLLRTSLVAAGTPDAALSDDHLRAAYAGEGVGHG